MKNYLEKIRALTLSDIFNIPVAIPDCFKCGEPNEIYQNFNGVGICYDCYDELQICSYCERRSLNIDNGICEQCATHSASIQGYGYKPEPVFHRVRMNRLNTPPLLTDRDYRVNEKGNQSYVWHAGIEIEADRHRNSDESPTYMGRLIASLVHLIGKGKTAKEQLLYSKNDCTCAVEIVSHPFSWNYWMLYGKELFKTLVQKLKDNNLYGYNAHNSGMHIHVSRKALKVSDIVKMVSFVYNPDNFKFILDISQRHLSRLEEWANPWMDTDTWNNLVKIARNHQEARYHSQRDTAINLQNRNTVEFRIFRGTLNFMSFCKNLEFVRSLCLWAKETSLDVAKNGKGLDSYLSFLEKNYNDYENLCYFLSHPEDGRSLYGVYDVVTERWTRENPENVKALKFNTDKGSKQDVYSNS